MVHCPPVQHKAYMVSCINCVSKMPALRYMMTPSIPLTTQRSALANVGGPRAISRRVNQPHQWTTIRRFASGPSEEGYQSPSGSLQGLKVLDLSRVLAVSPMYSLERCDGLVTDALLAPSRHRFARKFWPTMAPKLLRSRPLAQGQVSFPGHETKGC